MKSAFTISDFGGSPAGPGRSAWILVTLAESVWPMVRMVAMGVGRSMGQILRAGVSTRQRVAWQGAGNMRIIVTCGPSYEPIDEVRRITNFSTGQMGSRLARALAEAGHDVVCFKGVTATTKECAEPARVVTFATNDDLHAQLASLQTRQLVGAVFHAAALADFKIFWARDGQRKISSRAGAVTLQLVPSSKIISELRGLFPNARIAGWKYELDGTPADVAAKAARQIAENRTDACVMNGAAYGQGYGVYAADGERQHVVNTVALCTWAVAWVAGG